MTRRLGTGALALLAIATVGLGAPSGAADESIPTVGVQFHGTWTSYSRADRSRILDKLVAAGVEWVRIDIGWASFEFKRRGRTYAWYADRADAAIDQANDRGLHVLAVLWGTPSWANNGEAPRVPPEDPSEYARVARSLAKRYRGRVDAWEMWNEPNLDDFWAGGDPARYAELVRLAYPAFKAGDRDTTVVLGGPAYNDTDWLTALYANGIQGSFDVLATHPYLGAADAPPETPDDGTPYTLTHVAAVRELMTTNGDGDKDIWFTEFGWSKHRNTGTEPGWQRGVTSARQGEYLVRTLEWVASNAPYVTKVFWYNDRNRRTGDLHLDNFGLLRADLTVKPVYRALREYLEDRASA